jgi:hypothetical protein
VVEAAGLDGLLPHERMDDPGAEGPRRSGSRTTRGRWEVTAALLLLVAVPLSCCCMPYGPGAAGAALIVGVLLFLTSAHTTPATRRLYLVAAVVAWALIAIVYGWGVLTGFTWAVPWAPAGSGTAP